MLAYAAYLHGLSVGQLERDVLSRHLSDRGFTTVAEAVAAQDQAGAVDHAGFCAALQASLANGDFRLVMVLDSAPDELIQLSSFLEAKSPSLQIDLITMTTYDVDGSQVLVPQRVEPEKSKETVAALPRRGSSSSKGQLTEGSEVFERGIEAADESDKRGLRDLLTWTRQLEERGLARLSTFNGVANRMTLVPRLRGHDAGLVTIWNEKGPALAFWRSVFEKLAPTTLAKIDRLIAPREVGQGNTIRDVPTGLLDLLTQAYEEATSS